MYERGELPCYVEHKSGGNVLRWLQPIAEMDLEKYLPVFLDGLRVLDYPCCFIARRGAIEIFDYLHMRDALVIRIIPVLIPCLRANLSCGNLSVVQVSDRLSSTPVPTSQHTLLPRGTFCADWKLADWLAVALHAPCGDGTLGRGAQVTLERLEQLVFSTFSAGLELEKHHQQICSCLNTLLVDPRYSAAVPADTSGGMATTGVRDTWRENREKLHLNQAAASLDASTATPLARHGGAKGQGLGSVSPSDRNATLAERALHVLELLERAGSERAFRSIKRMVSGERPRLPPALLLITANRYYRWRWPQAANR
jgi:hypothetical protein